MAEITLKVSKPGDASKVDPSKIIKGQKPSETQGAEAQYPVWYDTYCSNPNCWAVNRVLGDTRWWTGFYCWNCGWYSEV